MFGAEELNLIIIIRNQVEVIRSLYRESVRVGLMGSYQEFVYNLYKFQDRNYLFDFRYDLVYQCLTELLPKENIHFIVFENCRDENKDLIMNDGKVQLVEYISNALDVSYLDVDFKHYNEALKDGEILAKSELNKVDRHDLGREMLFSVEIHRQVDYFRKELGLNEPEEVVYEDVLTKRKLLKEVTGNSKEIKLDYSLDNWLKEWLEDFFGSGNKSFQMNSGMILPESYIDIQF